MKTIDATTYRPKDRHKAIFDLFESLSKNESMLLINDHDPKPLYYTFQAEMPLAFEWVYQTAGPDVYEVIITKK